MKDQTYVISGQNRTKKSEFPRINTITVKEIHKDLKKKRIKELYLCVLQESTPRKSKEEKEASEIDQLL